jgi:3-deoxy-7-phosphoheptulonate synthase
MIIVMKKGATPDQVSHVCEKVVEAGLKTQVSHGVERTVIGIIGPEDKLQVDSFIVFPGVESVTPILKPYKLASRDFKPQDTVIEMGDGVKIGAKRIAVMGGPCSIENYENLLKAAKSVKKMGGQFLRGGAYKPRSSPYSFQGLGLEGLKMMRTVADEVGLLAITEVMDPRQVAEICQYADMLQIGARNMQNFDLLKEIGKTRKPVLLKRGLSATIQEWLMSAEYLLSNGNFKVVLCERGIRTFETATRNTTDINAIPVIKALSHLPIIVDPSHSVGIWEYVAPVAKAAVAAGADGLMIEVHSNPEEALSDGPQSLKPSKFEKLMAELRPIAEAVGREI